MFICTCREKELFLSRPKFCCLSLAILVRTEAMFYCHLCLYVRLLSGALHITNSTWWSWNPNSTSYGLFFNCWFEIWIPYFASQVKFHWTLLLHDALMLQNELHETNSGWFIRARVRNMKFAEISFDIFPLSLNYSLCSNWFCCY